jgi:hypothetical protein
VSFLLFSFANLQVQISIHVTKGQWTNTQCCSIKTLVFNFFPLNDFIFIDSSHFVFKDTYGAKINLNFFLLTINFQAIKSKFGSIKLYLFTYYLET